jgi:DMSO/TMAO reductase YedYZ molybdopterin-dependent catalytic subunit
MSLTIEGEVISARSIGFEDLARAPDQVPDVGALVAGREGGGVWLRSVLGTTGVKPGARFATLASHDEAFAISVPLSPLLERALLVYRLGDAPLPPGKGGPVRVLLVDAPECGAEEVDACAGVKGLGRIRLTAERESDVGHKHR